MAQPTPTLDDWRRLYQAAIRIKEVAPWEWMEETDIFGVQNPETGELGFVSVMGVLGEHLAVALYPGPEGLQAFWEFEAIAEYAPPEAVLGLLHFQASFEDRNYLSPQDRAVIKKLGYKFRGRQAWPLFRSYRPGYCPWYLEPAEARFLAHALEQAVDVTLRFGDNPEILATLDENTYLVRVPREEDGALVWEDQVLKVPPPEPQPIPIAMDVDVLDEVKELPRATNLLEVDFFAVPACVGEKGTRPFYPYMFLMVESEIGLIVGMELLEPTPGLKEMWGRIPLTLLRQLARMGVVPERIRVRTPLFCEMLRPVAGELGLEVTASDTLPALDEAREELLKTLT